MKIKEKNGNILDIFGICWFKDKVYFYGLSKRDKKLTRYSKSDVIIVDKVINFRTIYVKNKPIGIGIYHRALIEENLLDDLFKGSSTAYNRFLEILKSEGLVDALY